VGRRHRASENIGINYHMHLRSLSRDPGRGVEVGVGGGGYFALQSSSAFRRRPSFPSSPRLLAGKRGHPPTWNLIRFNSASRRTRSRSTVSSPAKARGHVVGKWVPPPLLCGVLGRRFLAVIGPVVPDPSAARFRKVGFASWPPSLPPTLPRANAKSSTPPTWPSNFRFVLRFSALSASLLPRRGPADGGGGACVCSVTLVMRVSRR